MRVLAFLLGWARVHFGMPKVRPPRNRKDTEEIKSPQQAAENASVQPVIIEMVSDDELEAVEEEILRDYDDVFRALADA